MYYSAVDVTIECIQTRFNQKDFKVYQNIQDAYASAYSVLPKIILRAFLCMDSKRYSIYDGSVAQTGEAYSMIDLTKLQ